MNSKYLIYAKYRYESSETHIYETETKEEAENIVAVLELSEENYDIRFEIKDREDIQQIVCPE